jgi:hypothetical protein
MYIDFASDWPAYLFMLTFIVFFVYIIVATKKDNSDNAKKEK